MKIYRLDKFTMPERSRREFLERIHEIHNVLRFQPGFVQDLLLEQAIDDESFNLVTLIEWENETYIEDARSAVVAHHKSTGFNPHDTMARLGIKADMGIYKNSHAQR